MIRAGFILLRRKPDLDRLRAICPYGYDLLRHGESGLYVLTPAAEPASPNTPAFTKDFDPPFRVGRERLPETCDILRAVDGARASIDMTVVRAALGLSAALGQCVMTALVSDDEPNCATVAEDGKLIFLRFRGYGADGELQTFTMAEGTISKSAPDSRIFGLGSRAAEDAFGNGIDLYEASANGAGFRRISREEGRVPAWLYAWNSLCSIIAIPFLILGLIAWGLTRREPSEKVWDVLTEWLPRFIVAGLGLAALWAVVRYVWAALIVP